MEKIKMFGLGTVKNRGRFIVDKTSNFREVFNELLENLKIRGQIFEEQEPILNREDEIDHFENEFFDIDIVYTNKRIIILVRADNLNILKFKTEIQKYFILE